MSDRESISQDPEVSPGPVGMDENLCRGAFSPVHLGQDKQIRPKVIALSHLRNCNLSVWREGGAKGIDFHIIKELLSDAAKKFNDNCLYSVLRANAECIRSMRYIMNGHDARCFLIVDECTCDGQGSKHHAHAHIGLFCELLDLDTGDRDDPTATWAQHTLLLLMRHQEVKV